MIKMYRENIYEILKATGEDINILVIPKNTGLKGYGWQVLKEAGLRLDETAPLDKSTLSVDGLTLWLRRGEDIPQIVQNEFENGKLVAGFSGDDLFDEYRLKNPRNTLKVENTYDWFDRKAKYLRPALCFMGVYPTADSIPTDAIVAINGKYELTARQELAGNEKLKGRRFFVQVYNGDLEATARSLDSCCIDTVYEGKTSSEFKLREYFDPIRFSDLVVITPLRKYGQSLLEQKASEIPRGEIIQT